MPRKKKNKFVAEEVETVVEEVETVVEEVQELREVIQPQVTKQASFRSLREAKKYAKTNGGKVVERGRFHVL